MVQYSSTQYPIYFTVIPVSDTGFTDQMSQFSTFYKFGLSLGYTYVHTPFISHRSSPKIYDFLGFNSNDVFLYRFSSNIWTKLISLFDKSRILDVELNDYLLESENISTFVELQNYVKNLISKTAKPIKGGNLSNLIHGQVIFIRIKHSSATDVEKFFIKLLNPQRKSAPAPQKHKIFYLINSNIQDFPDRLNLRSIYFNARTHAPRQSKFLNGKIKVLVHVRQGDLALIETSWKTWIAMYGKKHVNEFDSLEAVKKCAAPLVDYISPEEYYWFVKELFQFFDEDLFSTVTSSDGYQRAFGLIYSRANKFAFIKWICQYLNLNEDTFCGLKLPTRYQQFLWKFYKNNISSFNYNSDQARELNNLAVQYEKKFSMFESFRNSVCLIGENDENLYDLVHSTLIADVIIVANQQRMIPKILAMYADLSHPPIMLVLHKREQPPNYEQDLSLHSGKAEIIPVQIGNCNFQDLAAKVSEKLGSRV